MIFYFVKPFIIIYNNNNAVKFRWTVLHEAAYVGDVEILRLLLTQWKPNVEAKGTSQN